MQRSKRTFGLRGFVAEHEKCTSKYHISIMKRVLLTLYHQCGRLPGIEYFSKPGRSSVVGSTRCNFCQQSSLPPCCHTCRICCSSRSSNTYTPRPRRPQRATHAPLVASGSSYACSATAIALLLCSSATAVASIRPKDMQPHTWASRGIPSDVSAGLQI